MSIRGCCIVARASFVAGLARGRATWIKHGSVAIACAGRRPSGSYDAPISRKAATDGGTYGVRFWRQQANTGGCFEGSNEVITVVSI